VNAVMHSIAGQTRSGKSDRGGRVLKVRQAATLAYDVVRQQEIRHMLAAGGPYGHGCSDDENGIVDNT